MPSHHAVTPPVLSNLLVSWLEEDIRALRRQREELDERIRHVEQRLQTLHGANVFVAEGDEAHTNTFELATAAAFVQHQVPEPERMERAQEVVPATEDVVAPVAHRKRSIMSLKLDTRTHNALTNNDVKAFDQLISLTATELRALPGFGAGCLRDLELALDRVGIKLPSTSARAASASVDTLAPAPPAPGVDTPEIADAAPAGIVHDHAATYDAVTVLPHRFGAIRLQDLHVAMGIAETDADALLRADARWNTSGGTWFVREDVAQSWIAKRAIEVLNAVRTIGLEALFQSLKRVATHKFLDQGWQMPPRSLLVRMLQELRTEGVRFDIVHEIVSVDAPIHGGELSASVQALLAAFGANHRALTGAEVVASFQAVGLSDASAQLALSASPLVTRLERGVYGLVGRHADMRDIAGARARREAGKEAGKTVVVE